MALTFDDLLNVENNMTIPLDLETSDNIFELDNLSCDIVQTDSGKTIKLGKKSPFHESDSGMSEDFCSVGSPTESLLEVGSSGQMLDDLVDSLEFEPFCHGSDRDLANYFSVSSDADHSMVSPSNDFENEESEDSRPSSPEIVEKKIRGRPVRSKTTTRPASPPDAETADVTSSGVKSVKVLKVIKTSGTANTAAEVLKALEDRNKKNAVQAKVNRERKKQYIKSLEDELTDFKTENGHLKSENAAMKRNTKALEEEVEYLRAVLVNESSLSKLLGNIENVQNVRLKSSFLSRKRSADMDHDYLPKKPRQADKKQSGGVCLHVDNDTVSLEFCSKCAQMASCDDEI